MNILKKLPKFVEMVSVYAVIVAIVYTWSLIQFFWRFPSWLHYSPLGEVGVYFSYMVVVDLLESLLVLLLPLFLAFVLPSAWFLKKFVPMGTTVVLLFLGYFMLYYENFVDRVYSLTQLLQFGILIMAIMFLFAFLINRVEIFEKMISELSYRSMIFLYLWGPITVLAVFTVLIRNIF